MTRTRTWSVVVLGILLTAAAPWAATVEQEQAFVAAYKKAYETKDRAMLESFLYMKGADPTVLEFYKAMQANGMGGTVSSIELVALTPEDVKKAAEVKAMPGGPKVKIPVTPTRKLVIKVETKDENGSSTSTSQVFVAEVDGKLVIPVPAPAQ
jgi:hypothetical protein